MNSEPSSPAALNLSLPIQPASGHGWRLWFSRHNWLTWLGLCFILPLVIYYWQHYSDHLRQQQQAVFQQHADRIEQELQQRLKHIELLLGANAAYVSSSEYVSQAEWQHYVESLKLQQLYPGIQALGVVSYRRAVELPVLLGQLNLELQRRQELAQSAATVTLHPAGDRSHYAIVSHIQPATAQNRKVLGYDMLTNPLRTQTAMRAASLNQPAITAKVALQQDGGRTEQPGLVLMLPLYHHNAPLTTAEQKQAALLGFVYAAFRVREILPAAWHDSATVLPDIQWSSGLEEDSSQLLFASRSEHVVASPSASTADPKSPSVALQQHRHLDWYGQPFVLHIQNNQLFERTWLPLAEYELVLLASAALVLLFLLLSHLNLRRYQAECHSSQLQQHVQQQRQLLLLDEQRQSLALKASQLAWFEFDLRTGGAFYADIWWRMFDFAAPQLNPEPQQLFDLLHPSALALFRQDLQRLLAHGPDQDQQHYRFVSRQGRQLYCLVHFYVVRAAEGDAIRLCCTMQDQTLQQQQTEQRRQLAVLCQLDLSQALSLQSVVTLTTDFEPFLQQHWRWLLQFYCAALADTDAAQHPTTTSQPLQPPLEQIIQLIADVVQLYQPQASANNLQLIWQPQSISELLKLDRHRGWQMACGLLELACALAKPGTAVTLELLPFQTRLTFRLQLQLSDAAAPQCAQDLAALALHPLQATTILQQRLQAARFWAAQLGGEFSYQQALAQGLTPDQQSPPQQLSLQLQFPTAG
ncbi:CHASE domain-containing protein [Rheinheimera riviphila]|uniref:CHASE domain-containing protein n=1 Tax=Rheinheimera riviphila TaxID=1834037 RepID=UPI0013E34767|nr:CHASE domain-containing protein [Rheinheimera riviphila]